MKPNAEMKKYLENMGRRFWRREVVERYFPKQGVGVEVGVLFGDFSKLLLEVTEPTKLHLVDPWSHFASCRTTPAEDAFKYVFSRFSKNPLVEIHRAISEEVVGGFEDNSVDYVYIDANHSYKGCAADVKLWLPKVKSGGILAGDDFRNRLDGQPFGVVQAIGELIQEIGVFSEFHIIRDQFVGVKR